MGFVNEFKKKSDRNKILNDFENVLLSKGVEEELQLTLIEELEQILIENAN
jgi:signal recognition particle GTPase